VQGVIIFERRAGCGFAQDGFVQIAPSAVPMDVTSFRAYGGRAQLTEFSVPS